ncbi:MAG: bifunctional 2-keto-4-hydroxyglutarate aldolase/2-keto-3-deoxy-6-phosphogluconate aldolase [Clostridia bacterium]|nr:bifunctional 2-keto-4-hydroxyglutarate aldolase/2-keto-3-deoxy-6-phosphogluconate aldolase [Clostridia bacterium]
MDKELVLTKMTDVGVVAVVRAESGEKAKRIADACLNGGVSAIELTFTVPMAHNVIEELSAEYASGELVLGAGTVLDSETARIAILSGAQYIVSPYFDEDTVRLCNRYRVPCMPGAMTIKEVVAAMESGADIVKVFPGEVFGPKIIKAIKGPLPHAKLMPTGGVDTENAGEWIKAGAAAIGVGGALTAGAKTGDYASVTAKAKEFVAAVREARAK